MGLLGAIKTKKEEAPDLHQQLAAARTLRSEAWSAVELAQQDFDRDGSAATEQALIEARANAVSADLRLARAERLIEAAKEAEVARKHAQLVARRDQLEHELSDLVLDEERRPLAEKEANLLIEVAKVRGQRRKLECTILRRAQELSRTKDALGETVPSYFMDLYSLIPPQQVVREKLNAFVATQPRDDDAGFYATKLIFQLVGVT